MDFFKLLRRPASVNFIAISRLIKGLASLICATSIMVAQTAGAAIIFDQSPGPASLPGGWPISSTLNFFGGTGFRAADNFTLASATTISGINWWGQSQGGGDSFTFTFYSNSSGAPGAVLHSTTGSVTASSVSLGSVFDPETFYTATLTNAFSAAAGTAYWLSIFNAAADASWVWVLAGTAGDLSRQQQVGAATWPTTRGNLAFQLEGSTTAAVPEPASLAIFCLGLLLVGFSLRRTARF